MVEDITELTEGWFNAIYVLSFAGPGVLGYKELVLKTGVQSSKYVLSYEKDIMRAEVHVYKLLEDTIIPIPQIIVKDFTKSLVDFDYCFMEKLQGSNWMILDEKITPENKEKLIAELAKYTAALHNVKGDFFGYIKDDKQFQFHDWSSAFKGMMNTMIQDGREQGLDLPYDSIMNEFEALWGILDEITVPSLVNFDMWNKNIMLAEKDGEYYIDAIIDHERAFFGDPYAEFISSATICGDVLKSETFMENYSLISGKPFTFTRNDRIRLYMYNMYMTLLMGVEVYRYSEEEKKQRLAYCNQKIPNDLFELRDFLAN
ncbi:phosphotransferase family protein [Paenibacillus xylanexedens]|uniref:phosphotransferase family protein n=1 Tax=Paenibacillus xylanexedens TaxID=528191 RepID=UPI00142D35AF|nr:aminoglycoside phosphotransferase family protein [Paenibacillus xylanexedens]